VVLLGVLAQEAHPRLELRSQHGRRADRRTRGRHVDRARELDHRVVVQRARRRDDDVRGRVVGRVERRQPAGGGPRDHVRAADDRATQRVVAEDGLAEHVEDAILRVVLVHRDLLEHDLLLVGEILGVEARVPHHVRDDVERRRQVLVDDAGVDRRRLLARARVELGPHGVEDLVDLQRAVAVRAPEEHVLDQVRQAGLGDGLRRRAGCDPEPERHGSDGGHCLRHDPDTRVQDRQPVVRQGDARSA